jgi:hypothetical protein
VPVYGSRGGGVVVVGEVLAVWKGEPKRAAVSIGFLQTKSVWTELSDDVQDPFVTRAWDNLRSRVSADRFGGHWQPQRFTPPL